MSQIESPDDYREPQWYIDQQDVRDNMTCGTCRRMLWDCSCPQSVVCMHCGESQEDEKANPTRCEESPFGIHAFVSADKEP